MLYDVIQWVIVGGIVLFAVYKVVSTLVKTVSGKDDASCHGCEHCDLKKKCACDCDTNRKHKSSGNE